VKRRQSARRGELRATYGRYEGDLPDVIFAWGGDGANKRDGALLHYWFSRYEDNKFKTLAEELEARGYDLSTLVFSVMKKPTADTEGGK
jgi:hypothetical protein